MAKYNRRGTRRALQDKSLSNFGNAYVCVHSLVQDSAIYQVSNLRSTPQAGCRLRVSSEARDAVPNATPSARDAPSQNAASGSCRFCSGPRGHPRFQFAWASRSWRSRRRCEPLAASALYQRWGVLGEVGHRFGQRPRGAFCDRQGLAPFAPHLFFCQHRRTSPGSFSISTCCSITHRSAA